MLRLIKARSLVVSSEALPLRNLAYKKAILLLMLTEQLFLNGGDVRTRIGNLRVASRVDLKIIRDGKTSKYYSGSWGKSFTACRITCVARIKWKWLLISGLLSISSR